MKLDENTHGNPHRSIQGCPRGKTLEEKIQRWLRRAAKVADEQRRKERAFIERMIKL